MLERLLGQVVLQPTAEGLVAELRGNLVPILEDAGLSGGAGRGIVPETPTVRVRVA